MAQQITVSWRDDIDGSEAAETVSFGLDGRTYEIDLSEVNATALRRMLEEYVKAGRPVGRREGKPKTGRKPRAGDPERTRAIRAWAQANGFAVSPRGRISEQVLRAYAAQQSESLDVAEVEAVPDEPRPVARPAAGAPVFSGLH